jgi:hypothetical protein
MRVGMLARRVIVGKLHANFIADALAASVEVIAGHGKFPSDKKMREERPRCPSRGRYPARKCAFSVRHASGLARSRHSFAIAPAWRAPALAAPFAEF